MPQPPSPEAASRGGKASAQTRRKNANQRADVRARRKFEQAAERAAAVLIQAALGEGEFKELEPGERAKFAIKVLEYGVGRPRTVDPPEPPQTKQEAGLHISVGAPQGDFIQTPEADDAVQEREAEAMDVGE